MERNNLIKKGVVVAVILLFVSVSVIPSTGTNIVEKKHTMSTYYDGNTLYVGGSGPGNYTKIQDAIDDASNGDTVFVYNGTYYENVKVDKSINLMGEDKNSTVIDSKEYGYGYPIWITISLVNICNFSIINSFDDKFILGLRIGENKVPSIHNSQIKYINISNCIITNNSVGIWMENVEFVNVSNCDIYNNKIHGISILRSSSNIEIHHNNIYGNTWNGIFVDGKFLTKPNNVYIQGNNISNNGNGTFFDGGIHLSDCINRVTIKHNIFKSNNKDGIFLLRSNKNIIIENNFIGNVRGAHFRSYCFFNIWDGNYWDGWIGFGPHFILGRLFFNTIPWVNFDWHPATEPYDIGVG